MNRIDIPDRSRFVEIASCWDELDQLQIIKILKLAGQFAEGTMDYDKFIVQSFYVIARVQRNWISVLKERRLSKKIRIEKFANIYLAAVELTSFLFLDAEAENVEIHFNTITNHFPVLQTNGDNFYGPADLLTDLTFGEFKAGLDAMRQYFSTKTDEDLNLFIACLYRPALPWDNVKKRQKFNEELHEHYGKQLNSVPKHIKIGVLLWYANCIKYIQKEDLTINGSTINLSVLFPAPVEGEKSSPGLGWTGILHSIAKEGVFGDADKVESKGLFDVLLFMYDSYLQNERLKRNSKK